MHNDLSKHHWSDFNKKVDSYVERTQEDRNRFWAEWMLNIQDRYWKCSAHNCDCESFQLDNLKFLEELSAKKPCQAA